MLARGPQGVGKTTLPQAGRSTLRAGTAGHKAHGSVYLKMKAHLVHMVPNAPRLSGESN